MRAEIEVLAAAPLDFVTCIVPDNRDRSLVQEPRNNSLITLNWPSRNSTM
jgi:hypothetical protein